MELAEYTPFGSVNHREGSVTVPHGFTGQREDAANSLVLFPARAYDSQLGRFLQPDPFVQDPGDPQMLNRYAYVRNNPLRYVDPSGLDAADLAAVLWYYGMPMLATIAAIAAIAWGLARLFGRGGKQSAPDYSALLQDTGIRFLQKIVVPTISASQQFSQAGTTIVQGAQAVEQQVDDLLAAGEQIAADLGVSAGEAARAVGQALASALEPVEGVGWIALGGVITQLDSPFLPFADAPGVIVAAHGLSVAQAGGGALAAVGGLQVSYAVRGPQAYPGQTQGKIARELGKAWDSLTYGGPGKIIDIGGPPNLKGLPFWKKALFYTMHTLRALTGSLEHVSDFFTH